MCKTKSKDRKTINMRVNSVSLGKEIKGKEIRLVSYANWLNAKKLKCLCRRCEYGEGNTGLRKLGRGRENKELDLEHDGWEGYNIFVVR